MNKHSLILILALLIPIPLTVAQVRPWQPFEVALTAETAATNPYAAIPAESGADLVTATFTGTDGAAAGRAITVTGFWDGGRTWRLRFAPPLAGTWKYVTQSTDVGLNGRTGRLTVTAWSEVEKQENRSRRGIIQVATEGPRAGRHFVHADGTPFLWVGDTWWNWTKRGIELSTFQRLVDDRVAKGFTVGQLFVAANGWGRPSSLLNETFDVLDVDHMQQVDRMIRYANERGLTVWVHPWWSRENLDREAGPEKIRRWWRYLIHRLGAYNVVWVIAGEYNLGNYGGLGLPFWKELGAMIDREDPYERIIGAHPTPPGWSGGDGAPQWSTGTVLNDETWLDYHQSQPGHGRWRNELIPDIVAADYRRVPAKPTVVTEPWYEFVEGNPTGRDIRFGAWSAILSGAAGHSYGGGHVWRAHVPERPGGPDAWPQDLSFERNTLDYDGAVSMGHLSRFLQRLEWWRLEPHPELLHETADPYCAAVPGEEYVVYLRWGGGVKIDLRPSADADQFEWTWFNPATGESGGTGQVSGGAIRYFSPPEDYPGTLEFRDWVLHVRRRAR
jgi:hypothetical protein